MSTDEETTRTISEKWAGGSQGRAQGPEAGSALMLPGPRWNELKRIGKQFPENKSTSVGIFVLFTFTITRLKIDPQKTLGEGRWPEEVGFLPEESPQRL